MFYSNCHSFTHKLLPVTIAQKIQAVIKCTSVDQQIWDTTLKIKMFKVYFNKESYGSVQ